MIELFNSFVSSNLSVGALINSFVNPYIAIFYIVVSLFFGIGTFLYAKKCDKKKPIIWGILGLLFAFFPLLYLFWESHKMSLVIKKQ